MNATTTHEAKAAEYRAQAESCDEDNARIIRDQVDPGDSFLSSWANSLNSSLYGEKARIEEMGGLDTFWGLFNAETGERVRAKLIDGKYGLCWALCNAQGRFTGKFIGFIGSAPQRPWSSRYGKTTEEREDGRKIYKRDIRSWARKVKNQEKKGYREGKEMAPATAYMNGEGHGLSGRAWVAVKRTDKGYPENAVSA